MKRLFLLCSAVFSAAALAGSAHAAHAADAGPDSGTKLEFTTEGRAQGVPTLLTIRLFGHASNANPAQAQQILNRQIATAIKAASGQDGIEVRAGSYGISQEFPEHGTVHWNARQDLTLSGTDSVRLLAIAGTLQEQGLAMEGLDCSLDPQTRDHLMQDARKQALEKVRKDAQADAEALGLRFVGLTNVRVSTTEPGPRPMMLMAARMASAPTPPQSSPEEQTLRVTVSVQAKLVP